MLRLSSVVVRLTVYALPTLQHETHFATRWKAIGPQLAALTGGRGFAIRLQVGVQVPGGVAAAEPVSTSGHPLRGREVQDARRRRDALHSAAAHERARAHPQNALRRLPHPLPQVRKAAARSREQQRFPLSAWHTTSAVAPSSVDVRGVCSQCSAVGGTFGHVCVQSNASAELSTIVFTRAQPSQPPSALPSAAPSALPSQSANLQILRSVPPRRGRGNVPSTPV